MWGCGTRRDYKITSPMVNFNFPFEFIGASLAKSDKNGWFQVDFLKWTKITASKTQGHADDDHCIQTFELHYSTNGIDFTVYKEYGFVKV